MNQEINTEDFAEPILPLGHGVILRGEEITAHHRKWMSGSYHCPKCGLPIDPQHPERCKHQIQT